MICSIEECEGQILLRRKNPHGYCEGHFWRWKRHDNPRAGKGFPPGISLSTKIKLLTDKKDGCWIWLGERQPNGYGKIKINGKYRTITHLIRPDLKASFPKRLILHTCDNPPCVNPLHLRIGTHKDNSRDMMIKGRGNWAKGERNGYSKLTVEQVLEIRKQYENGRSQTVIAHEFEIAQSHISRIVRKEVWKD